MYKKKIEENKKKINFFKKVYYSIFKIYEYDNMIKEGILSSVAYLLINLLIISLVPTIFQSYSSKNDIAVFLIYYIEYFIFLVIIMGINLILVEIIAIIIFKIKKIRLKPTEFFSLSVYAGTLGNLIYICYLIFSYLTKISLRFIGITYLIVAYLYVKEIASKKVKEITDSIQKSE